MNSCTLRRTGRKRAAMSNVDRIVASVESWPVNRQKTPCRATMLLR